MSIDIEARDETRRPVAAEQAEAVLESPLGPIRLRTAGGAVVALRWAKTELPATPEAALTPFIRRVRDQLASYFAGHLDRFDVPVRPAGSEFCRQVWAAMQRIPKGQVRTYGDVARELGAPARAVGSACGANPIPIIIPCHRIVGANGRLGGFSSSGGVEDKVWLLRHEGVLL